MNPQIARVSRILSASLLFLLAAPAAAASERGLSLTTPAPIHKGTLGTYHALIIGINAYEEWNPLQTAVKDATALRDLLVEQYGFDKTHVILRTDEEATRPQIIRDLRSLASGLGEKDNLLVYFAGHGQLDDLTGDGYWIPAEGRLKDPSSWISHSVLKGILGSDRVKAKNVVVIADSCYSGTLLRGGPSLLKMEDEEAYLEKLIEAASKRSRQVITSGGLEPVADAGRDGHSLFAFYLLAALRENDREVVDLENLFHTRVWAPVTQIGNQRPNVGRLKTPMDEDGQFVLRNQGLSKEEEARAANESQLQRNDEEWQRLQAELARLEDDRKRLETERRILEERKRLQAERLELEKEKQRLALEAQRKSTEREKAVPEKQEAPSKPPARVASLPPSSSDAVHTVAIFPWHFECIDPFHKGKVPSAEGFHERLMAFFEEDRGFRLTHSHYELTGSPLKGVQRLGAGEVDPDAVWEKAGVLSSPEPAAEAVYEAGKKLGVDLVLMIRILKCNRVWIYVYDIPRREAHVSHEFISGWGYLENLYLETTGHLERGALKNPPG